MSEDSGFWSAFDDKRFQGWSRGILFGAVSRNGKVVVVVCITPPSKCSESGVLCSYAHSLLMTKTDFLLSYEIQAEQ